MVGREKRREETKILKRMGKLNEGVGALKLGETGTPLRTMSKGTIFAKNTDFLQKSWHQQN